MSTDDDAPNKEHDTSTDTEPRTASFDEGLQRANRELQKRKTRRYELPSEEGEEPIVWEFTIKKLTGEERDEVEDEAIEFTEKRNETNVEMNTGRLKKEQIKRGVVDGPEGFKLTDRHIEKLPYEVRDDLADAIENFSTLDEEERIAF